MTMHQQTYSLLSAPCTVLWQEPSTDMTVAVSKLIELDFNSDKTKSHQSKQKKYR